MALQEEDLNSSNLGEDFKLCLSAHIIQTILVGKCMQLCNYLGIQKYILPILNSTKNYTILCTY